MGEAIPTIQDIQRRVADAVFGRPLITNIHRGLLVEAIVAFSLEPEWRWCSEDYSPWDFERDDGTKLEVKQSAVRQSWTGGAGKPSACSFDIASRKGRWEGAAWIDAPGRNAHLYVLAHHPVFDDTADHRDPVQWLFYVLPAAWLPQTRQIALSNVRGLVDGCRFDDLK